jgi:hypothetical protein
MHLLEASKPAVAADAVANNVTERHARAMQNIGWAALGLLTVAYVGFFVQLTSLPYQDFPNHLARAVVMADLIFHHGAQFGQLYDYHFMPVPYIIGDLLLTGAVELLGPTLAAALWNAIVLLSLPAALLFYLHVNEVPRGGRAFALLLSLYLATDWFYLMGFTQFRLGLALMLLAIGCVDLLRRRWSARWFLFYCALVVIAYLSHLAAVIFLAPALTISSLARLWFRRTTLRRELWLIAPVLLILGWHFAVGQRAQEGGAALPAYHYVWGTVFLKLQGLDLELLRFGQTFSKVMMIMLTVSLLWGMQRDLRWRNLTKPAVVEMLALAVTFLGIYIVLPSSYADAAYVDVRALAPVTLFLILARVYLPDDASSERAFSDAVTLPFVAILAMCNLGYLASYMYRYNEWADGYREIVADIPRGARVLPVYTNGRVGTVAPLLHMGSYVVTDRGAVTPYLFSGNGGHPMKYFRYKETLYAPPQRWYNAQLPVVISARAIACNYEYLLVDKPFDARRLGLRAATVAENGSAALMALDSHGYTCDKPRGDQQLTAVQR